MNIQGGQLKKNIIYPELSYKIVGILFEVCNELGGGYQEKYYQKALELAFENAKINYVSQCPYIIRFKEKIIGRYYMDFVLENKIVLEIKRGNYFSKSNIKQILGYLKSTKYKLGFLANFTDNGLKFKRIPNLY